MQAMPNFVVEAEELDLGMESPRCHSSTLCEMTDAIGLAFFGGMYGGTVDQGIWFTRKSGTTWEPPRLLARPEELGAICWNPVLHYLPDGTLLLFFKEGPKCKSWWGMLQRSHDDGRTWEPAKPLPQDIYGPIRNKAIELPDGGLLCGSSTEHGAWCVHFERTPDAGATWTRTPAVAEDRPYGAIQPTILPWPSGRWQALCRSKVGCVVETFSEDQGLTWSPLSPVELQNPNAAIDAVLLTEKSALLVYNPADPGHSIHDHREVLALALTEDGGESWHRIATLEDQLGGEFSYPAMIRTRDGLVHISYTTGIGWTGTKHVVLDPAALPRPAES